MNFYKPSDIFAGNELLGHLPDSIKVDYAVRSGIEVALRAANEEVQLISKELAERGLMPLGSVCLEKPIRLPFLQDHGSHNNVLQLFAIEAYEEAILLDSEGYDWYILPYVNDDEDLEAVINLGIFVD